MESNQSETIRMRLLAERSRLENELADIEQSRDEALGRSERRSNLPTHSADVSTGDVNKQLAIEQSLRDELHAVVNALTRLSDGKYGVCQECGGQISAERLEALPHVRYCLACERDRERANEGVG